MGKEDLIDHYRKSTVYWQLSKSEGFGSALAEVVLCGCTPIETDRLALSEAVGDVGCVVPIGDEDTIRGAIKTAVESLPEAV